MNIAMMTTWNQVCGISDYAMSLVRHFPEEHNVKIIGPKLNERHHSLKPINGPDDPFVERMWNATIWDGIVKVDMPEIQNIVDWADVFHIQFQDALYHHEWLYHLVERTKNRAKTVITLHDSCLNKIYPMLGSFNEVFTMKPEVQMQYPQAKLMNMPTYDLPPLIRGFGLGRSKHDNIKAVCEDLGYRYEYNLAEDKWLPIDELISWLREADAIVLYYDEVGTAGSSAAARTALSSRRPVFVNNVTWFNDLPDDAIIRFEDDEDLKSKLKDHLQRPYISANSFERAAEFHLDHYKI